MTKAAVHPLAVVNDVITQPTGESRLADTRERVIWRVNHAATAYARIGRARIVVVHVTVTSGVTRLTDTTVITSVFNTGPEFTRFCHARVVPDVTVLPDVVLFAVTCVAVSSGGGARAMHARVVGAHSQKLLAALSCKISLTRARVIID